MFRQRYPRGQGSPRSPHPRIRYRLLRRFLESGLQAAARAIRAEVSGATADKFRDMLGFVKRTDMEILTWPSVLDFVSIGSVLYVSYFGFEIQKLGFRGALRGKIEAFRLPSRGILPGMPVVRLRLLDGSCEFIINEQEEVKEFFAGMRYFGDLRANSVRIAQSARSLSE